MPPLRNFIPNVDHFSEKGIADFQQHYYELISAVRQLQGANGPIQLLANVDLGGNKVVNAGAATGDNDLLTKAAADPMYSTQVQQAAMEAVGARMLQTTRRLNDGTQQHKISTDLNLQGSIPPTLTGTTSYTSTATSITVSYPTSIQFGDQSIIAIPNVPLLVTGLVAGSGFIYPYYDTRLGLGQLVADAVNATGVPPVVFAAVSDSAAQAQNGDGRVPLSSGGVPVTIVASGGGSGGGSGCIRAGMLVLSRSQGIVAIESLGIGEEILARQGWTKVVRKIIGVDRVFVRLMVSNGESLQVTPTHKMALFSGVDKPAGDLALCDLVCAKEDSESPVQIMELSLVNQVGKTVLLSCNPYHDYLVGSTRPTIVACNFNLPK